MTPAASQPHLTVGLATRDRGGAITATIASLAALRYGNFDVIVLDQSRDDTTEAAVRAAAGDDHRIQYVRSPTAGLSVARNEVIARAAGQMIAFTDDDCVVSPDWLDALAGHFEGQPRVGLVFGEVRAAPFDHAAGFTPVSAVTTERRVSNPWLKWRQKGIGANMALRATVPARIGGFDPLLGAGASLRAGEDFDMAYRVLKAGFEVLDVPDAVVVHHGFRDWEEVRRLMPGSGMGAGAAYMKHLRLGDVAVAPTLLVEWARCISWRRLLLLRRGAGLGLFLAFGRGLAGSFRHRIDAPSRTYVS